MSIRGHGLVRVAARVGVCVAALLALQHAGAAAQPDEAETEALPEARSRTFAALKPQGVFAQFGVADEVTAGTFGALWNVGGDPAGRGWSAYVEASVSRWQSRGGRPSDHGVLTQVALVPVLRWRPDEGRSPWFVEGGIGATLTSSLYHSEDKHFSTAFNFGDHLGAGFSFGEKSANEIALRAEHFSNAGIKHPNPGKNFLQLRFVHRFE